MKPITSRQFTVHQYHHSASPNDAVTNHMLWIQSSLGKIGIAGEVFSDQIKNLPDGSIRPFSLNHTWNCDLFLLHHSQGNPNLNKVLRLEVPKALVYHNITPSHFYRHDPYLYDLCQLGRKQLKALRSEVAFSYADSMYNALELSELGFEKVSQLPLLNISKPLVKEINEETEHPLHLLFAGRVTPHKNQAWLIKVFFYLKEVFPKHSKLYLVGKVDPVYGKYLKQLIQALGLTKEVVLTGSISKKELVSLYQIADAFICPSLHEGFCIPLVEAMVNQLPVFALKSAAVPETLGMAGILLNEKAPEKAAAILYTFLKDKKAIAAILEGQAKRLNQLIEFQNEKMLQELILKALQLTSSQYETDLNQSKESPHG